MYRRHLTKNVLVRTVTHYHIGRLVDVDSDSLLLESASWVADTGRFGVALQTGQIREYEPFPGSGEVIIGRGAIVDCCAWDHELPRTPQK